MTALVVFGTVFALMWVALPLIATVAHLYLPRMVTNLFFFWPQLVTPIYGITASGDSSTLVVRSTVAVTLAIAWWSFVGVAFGWLFRRYALSVMLIAAVPYIMVIAFVTVVLLSSCGYTPYLDGP